MAESSADIVIVGGGIAGMTTAYYLAKSGVPSVVVERDAIGRHASGFAYGGLSPLSCATAVLALGPWSAEASDRRPLVGGNHRGSGRRRRGVDGCGPRRDRRCAPEDVARDGGRAGRAADRLPASGGIRWAPRARLCARARSGLRGHGRRSQGHPLRSRHGACDRRSRPRSGHARRARRVRARPLRWRSRIALLRWLITPLADHAFFGDQPYTLVQAPPISIARSLSLRRWVWRKGSTACS